MPAQPGYCFRIRIRLGLHTNLASTEREQLVFATAAEHGEDVVLRPTARGAVLGNNRDVALHGRRYATAAEAEEAAARWAARLQVALSRLHLGADFGLRAPGGFITQAGLEMFSQQTGRRVVRDVHGPMVYECDPEPLFARLGPITGVVGKPADRLVELVRAASELELAWGEREQLAFDLYSASFSEENADARFLMLMMALETLIEQEPRSAAAVAHLERLKSATRAAELEPGEADSLCGSLDSLARRESVLSAGRRLAGALGTTEYLPGEPPPVFFTRCYELRSSLVHGHYPRPDRGQVGERAAPLEGFVGDLLGAALLER